MGRLSTVTDWLGHTTTYGYGDAWTPDTPTTVTFPSAIGVTATYGYSNTGNVTSLAASSTVTSGPAISDSWGQNPDEQVNATTINSAAATSETYDGYGHVTHAANLYTSTSNDVFTVAANGEITTDAPPSGSSTSYAYNSGEELCSVNTSASASCTGTPTNGAVFSYTTNGQRASLTPYSSGTPGAVTDYAWNAFGELCNVATSATACGTTPTSGTSYSYNGNGVRMSAVTSSSTTDFTWDNVSAGGTPLDLNDATTTSSGTTNTSYLYGDLLFGGTAPVEQITTTTSGATVSYLVSNQTGVQGVYNGSGSSLGAVQEMAVYSVYGNQNFTSGTKVTPFAFQGSYSDPTGLLYLINRYYDPATDEFLSIDPDVVTTDQPYVFTNDDPLNAEDPLGLFSCSSPSSKFCESLLSSNKNAKTAFDYFVVLGLTTKEAAGIVGNFEVESGVNPKDGVDPYGIGQWQGGRLSTGLDVFAKQVHGSVSSLTVQLDYAANELGLGDFSSKHAGNGNYSFVIPEISGLSPARAAAVFDARYEGGSNVTSRENFATVAYNLWGV
jgi:RHS repeat-associated protein